MDFHQEEVRERHHREFVKMMRAKSRYLSDRNWETQFPYFEAGHHVGVFCHLPEPYHVFGTIESDDERGVIVKTDEGQILRVSQWQIFRTSKAEE